jgi:hypothetical protein
MWCWSGHLRKECAEKEIHLQHRHSAIASWQKERKLIPTTIGAAATRRTRRTRGSLRDHPRLEREGSSHPVLQPYICPSRRRHGKASSNSSGLTPGCSGRPSYSGSTEGHGAFVATSSIGNSSVSSGYSSSAGLDSAQWPLHKLF